MAAPSHVVARHERMTGRPLFEGSQLERVR
jgi:hypothetical protein